MLNGWGADRFEGPDIFICTFGFFDAALLRSLLNLKDFNPRFLAMVNEESVPYP